MRSSTESVSQLAARIRAIEADHRPHWHATVPLSIPGLAEAFPEQRLPRGSLLELLAGEPGVGATTLALTLARQAAAERQAVMVIDPRHDFYPPAALARGLNLERTFIIRPRTALAAVQAITQSLRCPALGAVLGWVDRLAAAEFRRLQLAAEAGRGLGLLIRPIAVRTTPSFAHVRAILSPLPASATGRRLELEVVRWRGHAAGQKVLLEIDDAGALRVPAAMAAATATARATVASA